MVIDQPAILIVRPVAAGLQAKGRRIGIKAALEAVKRVLIPQRLADHREIAGLAPGHGGKDRLDGVECRLGRHQSGDLVFGNDQHQ